MKKIVVFICLSIGMLYAQNCENKTFSLSTRSAKSLSLYNVLSDLTSQCGITVTFADDRSKSKIYSKIGLLNIKDYSLDEFLDLLFSQTNLFYDLDRGRNILNVSYYQVKSFNVNYVNMSRLSTETTKSITVGTNNVVSSDTTGSSSSSSSSSSTTSSTSARNSNADATKIVASLEFTFWDKLQDHITQILSTDENYSKSTNRVLVDRDASVVTVSGTKRQIDSVQRYLAKIQERMHKQVMIDAYILELTYEDENSTGVDWSTFEWNLKPNFTYNEQKGNKITDSTTHTWTFNADFLPSAVIKFLNTYGDVDVVSNPKVLTLNNQPAVINVGNQLNYLYQSGSTTVSGSGLNSDTEYTLGTTFVGLTLSVIPEITENNQIMMRINPVTSQLLNEESSTSSSSYRTIPPDTKIKQMSSIVKVNDNQKVIIGGLIEKQKTTENSKVPVLGDIPLLGYAFSHEGVVTKKRELFIILTPTLIKNNNFPKLSESIEKRLN